ncbi:unnamed protein product [Caretta caretta]
MTKKIVAYIEVTHSASDSSSDEEEMEGYDWLIWYHEWKLEENPPDNKAKEYPRNCMTSDRLRDLALMAIEKKVV